MIKSLSSLRFVFAIMVFLIHIHKVNVAIGHAFFYRFKRIYLVVGVRKKNFRTEIFFCFFLQKKVVTNVSAPYSDFVVSHSFVFFVE